MFPEPPVVHQVAESSVFMFVFSEFGANNVTIIPSSFIAFGLKVEDLNSSLLAFS